MTTFKHLSWLDHYRCKASEEPQGPSEIAEEGHGVCNRTVESYLNYDPKFNECIEENPNFNFLLLPSSVRGLLNVIHCVSMFDDHSNDSATLVGVNRTRFNSPWKVIVQDKVTSSLRKPSPTEVLIFRLVERH